jgi:hypothetical protein
MLIRSKRPLWVGFCRSSGIEINLLARSRVMTRKPLRPPWTYRCGVRRDTPTWPDAVATVAGARSKTTEATTSPFSAMARISLAPASSATGPAFAITGLADNGILIVLPQSQRRSGAARSPLSPRAFGLSEGHRHYLPWWHLWRVFRPPGWVGERNRHAELQVDKGVTRLIRWFLSVVD